MKKYLAGLLSAALLATSCMGTAFAASSPAANPVASPVMAFLDGDTVNISATAPSGATAAVVEKDGNKVLECNYTSGTRGLLQVTSGLYYSTYCAGGQYDVMLGSDVGNTMMQLGFNFGGWRTPDNFAGVALTATLFRGNGDKAAAKETWYRVKYQFDADAHTIHTDVYAINADGTTGALYYTGPTADLGANFTASTRMNTVNIDHSYARGHIYYDNFVFYNALVNTVGFSVGEGGTVTAGSNTITSASTGLQKEIAFAAGETASFTVTPNAGYEIDTVKVDGAEVQDLNVEGDTVTLGTLSANKKVDVTFAKAGAVKLTDKVCSPAWTAATPIVDVMDFDNVSATVAGSGVHTFFTTGSGGSHPYVFTEENGNKAMAYQSVDSTQRTIRIGIEKTNVIAGDFDFYISPNCTNTNTLQPQIQFAGTTNLFTVVNGVQLRYDPLDGSKNKSLTKGQWYRVKWAVDKAAQQINYNVYTLDANGKISSLFVSNANPVTITGGWNADMQLVRYQLSAINPQTAPLLMDNFVEYSEAANTAKFAVGEGGKVTVSGHDITSASKGIASDVAVAAGKTFGFTVTPDEGKQIKSVKVGDADVVYDDANACYIVNMSADATVTVEFESIPTENYEIAENATEALPGEYQGKPAFAVYSMINSSSSEAQVGYGIKLWKTDDSANVLDLPACAVGGSPAIAASNAQFAVRVFGDAIQSATSYTYLPYVGTFEGQSAEITLE